jgi:hypothetical protein
MSIIEIRVAGRYKIKKKIGSGSFGDIYLGIFPFPQPYTSSPKRSNQRRIRRQAGTNDSL